MAENQSSGAQLVKRLLNRSSLAHDPSQAVNPAAITDFTRLDRKGGFYIEGFHSYFIPHNVWATGAVTLWAQGITGIGSVVGIIDTGVDDSHPDLKAAFKGRRDYVQDGAKPHEFATHGTHVAGTILANGKIRGVAPGAKFIDYRVLGKDGSGNNRDITQAIEDAIADKCTILNLSLGGPDDYKPMHHAIKRATDAGILVICAAGNEREIHDPPGSFQISYPGHYHEVIVVGAVDLNLNSLVTAYFSNQNNEVDICAVGVDVLSTFPRGTYDAISGTSMATPTVAGFAALLSEKAYIANNQAPLTESIRYMMLKTFTVDVFARGVDPASGAGFATAFPAVPKVNSTGNWFLPTMKYGQPKTK